MLNEIKTRLRINKDSLDNELIEQAELLFSISDLYETALTERDFLKEELAQVDARLDHKYRNGKEKITEAMVKSFVLIDKDHTKAFTAYADARLKAGQLAALKDSFKERGYMLRELCGLFLAGYYEQNSVRSTANTDAALYRQRRAK